jgi:hypothetical protein
MAGYTPVFDSVFHGTLCGKWPTLPVWLTILPMADRNGHIEMSYQAMSTLTGWPVDLLKQAMAELTAPDPESRSEAEEGRRLVLIDPENRSWGWRVVNHGKYRERARKQAWDAERTSSGKDAERKRVSRGTSRDVPTSPDASRLSPLSDTNTDTNTDKHTRSVRETEDVAPEPFARLRESYPPGLYGDNDWLLAEREIRGRVASGVPLADLVAAAAAYGLQQQATGRVGTQYIQAPSRFFAKDGKWRGPFPTPAKPENAYDRLMRLNGGTPNDTRIIEHEPDRAGPDYLALA